jgi:hypothetical protein
MLNTLGELAIGKEINLKDAFKLKMFSVNVSCVSCVPSCVPCVLPYVSLNPVPTTHPQKPQKHPILSLGQIWLWLLLFCLL